MVRGIDIFQDYFSKYQNQYVLIGGAACDISFQENDAEFRATRDLDIVLIVEALTPEFGEKFWQFINDGGYQNRAKSSANPQFYRFDKPMNVSFPMMIELFSRADFILQQDSVVTPIRIDDDVSSLSAILLDDDYYETLLKGRRIVNGISILAPLYLIAFKAKAWLDLNDKKQKGHHVDSKDVKKHKNDVLRMATLLIPGDRCELPETVQSDMSLFIENLDVIPSDLKNLKIPVKVDDLIRVLKETYL